MRAEALLVLAWLGAASCYASNVVATGDRAVATAALPTGWQPAKPEQLRGLFASASITGDAALALRAAFYWFAADGRYSGAALVDGDEGLAFQTLGGTWSIEQGLLRLDDTAPVPIEAAEDWLRITAPNGQIVLRRSGDR